jgi:sugar/nucleoside kinase (ribokinase family)
VAEKEAKVKTIVLGDLIADISMRLPKFPVQAKDIHRLSFMEVGPGGACNIAIMAARFGVPVNAVGEVGDDGFGLVVREGLKRESINVDYLQVTPGARTPVAGVVVDKAGEPGYLGYAGTLKTRAWPDDWNAAFEGIKALFADGWAEYPETPSLILHGFELARKSGALTFFDPGPGNPDVNDAWMLDAIRLSTVVLMNRREAKRLTGLDDDEAVIKKIQGLGAELVLLKRGEEGLLAARGTEREQSAGLDVVARDATGAGDSVAGAMIYGVLNKLPLRSLATLANATGAAKVTKLGTGHNMPTMTEIADVLKSNGQNPAALLPGLAGLNA